MGDNEQLAKLTVEVQHIREKVDHIDQRLEAINISSRLAVLEDRQNMVFRLFYGVTAFFGSVLSGIIIWLFTH